VGETYGRNTTQVEWVLAKLGELPVAGWKSLEDAYARSETLDAAEDALATVLTEADLRQSWFELRARATSIAKKAAADYAVATGETARTIEHAAAVNAWDGQHESSSLEVLGPVHERGFIDGACGALGVVLMRQYIGDKDFERFWQPYEPVIGLLTA
jgi:hypothetical protein